MRLKLGNPAGLFMTIVPSDVREHAASGSIMLPATTIMPILGIPAIERIQCLLMFRGMNIVEILGQKSISSSISIDLYVMCSRKRMLPLATPRACGYP
jgi:hypothetical protein